MLWEVRTFDTSGNTDDTNDFYLVGKIRLAEDEQYDDETIAERLIDLGVFDDGIDVNTLDISGDDSYVFVKNAKTGNPICKLISDEVNDD